MTEVRRTQMVEPVLLEDLGHFGNVYVRHITFPLAGAVMHGHSHHFDHVTLLSQGQVDMTWRDAEGASQRRRYSAPALIHTAAEVFHDFTALEDETEAWCIFAVRGLDGAVLSATEIADGRPVIGF